MTVESSRPFTSFMVKYTPPSAVRPLSYTGTMFGCCSCAVICTSSTNRASAAGLSPSARTCFIAMTRFSSTSRTRRTSPMPPCPMRPRSTYRDVPVVWTRGASSVGPSPPWEKSPVPSRETGSPSSDRVMLDGAASAAARRMSSSSAGASFRARSSNHVNASCNIGASRAEDTYPALLSTTGRAAIPGVAVFAAGLADLDGDGLLDRRRPAAALVRERWRLLHRVSDRRAAGR